MLLTGWGADGAEGGTRVGWVAAVGVDEAVAGVAGFATEDAPGPVLLTGWGADGAEGGTGVG